MITYLDMDSGTTHIEAPDAGISQPAPQQGLILDCTFPVAPRLEAWPDHRVTASPRPSIALIEACLAQLDAGRG